MPGLKCFWSTLPTTLFLHLKHSIVSFQNWAAHRGAQQGVSPVTMITHKGLDEVHTIQELSKGSTMLRIEEEGSEDCSLEMKIYRYYVSSPKYLG